MLGFTLTSAPSSHLQQYHVRVDVRVDLGGEAASGTTQTAISPPLMDGPPLNRRDLPESGDGDVTKEEKSIEVLGIDLGKTSCSVVRWTEAAPLWCGGACVARR